MNKYLLILLIFSCTSAVAAISKWVDSSGQVHYSDQPPPPDARSKTISSGAENQESAASGVAAPKSIAEREAELRKAQAEKQIAADKAGKSQASIDAQKASCAAAQQNLRNLQDGMRMVEVDANGEQVYLDDKQREERIAKSQNEISKYCK